MRFVDPFIIIQCFCLVHARSNLLPELLEIFEGNSNVHKFLQTEYQDFQKLMMMRTETPDNTNNIITEVVFRLYTRSNRNESFNIEPTAKSVAASPFDPRKPTRFMTHGFWSSGDSDTSQNVKNAYLTYQDVNVILVDWKGPAATINYISAALNTMPIGAYTARLLDTLTDSGADPRSIHLVGHSLGAHISGFAGKYAKHKVARITGLDPAGPLFETIPLVNDHLSVDKADFVDVIHTSAGALGYRQPIGDVDFYPNGGIAPQPGCAGVSYVLGGIGSMVDSCSHGRSWVYFADSINPTERYVAESPLEPFSKMPVELHPSEIMGEYVDEHGHGVFYLRTNSQAPFALNH